MIASYLETLQNLYALNTKKCRQLGLDSIRQLTEKLGNPQKSFPSVLVAGSNGKGSTTWKIAKVLTLAGYRVGLYTSPHISSFRERIRVDGELISEEDVADICSQLFSLGTESTYFELITALAFDYFRKKQVDIAILEVGLGGRLDATNIVDPILSVITSISLEHTEILGDTLEKICYEKAGIARAGIPLVVGPDVPLAPLVGFKETLTVVQDNGEEDINKALAEEVLRLLQPQFPHSLSEGLQQLPPCRRESFEEGNFILDVAHNPASLKRLAESLEGPTTWVLSMSEGKDIASSLEAIRDKVSCLIITQGNHPRCLKPEKLKDAWFPEISCLIAESVTEAIALARQQKAKPVVVAGTFFMMGEARKALGYEGPTDPYQLNEFFKMKKGR